MSKTHTGEIIRAAKKLSRWLVDKARAAGAPTTEAEIQARLDALCKGLSSEEREAVGKAGLIFFKQADPVGYGRVIVNAMAGLSEIGSGP